MLPMVKERRIQNLPSVLGIDIVSFFSSEWWSEIRLAVLYLHAFKLQGNLGCCLHIRT